jgi:hypothetical protein
MTKKKNNTINDEGLLFLGTGKSAPWMPYRKITKNDPKIYYWHCNYCKCILWSTDKTPPHCNCRMQFKYKHPKIHEIINCIKNNFIDIFKRRI